MKFHCCLYTIAFAAVCVGPAALAKPGNHDPAFNHGANVAVPFNYVKVNGQEPVMLGLAKSDSGGYLAGFGYYTDSTTFVSEIRRFKADGTPDTALNNTGISQVYYGSGGHIAAMGVGLQDEIFLAGYIGSEESIIIHAVERDGLADPNFNGGQDFSRLPAYFGVYYLSPSAVAVQPWDGKIVVAGRAGGSNGVGTNVAVIFLLRLLPNGTLDAGFGNNGFVQYGAGFGDTTGAALAFDADHKIVVVGSTHGSNTTQDDFEVARFNANGSISNQFSYDFHVGDTFNDYASDVKIDSLGDIVIVGQAATEQNIYGSTSSSVGILRLNPDFTPDSFLYFGHPAYNTYIEGVTAQYVGQESDVAPGVAVDAQNNLMIASGYAELDTWRFTEINGTDTAWNNGTVGPGFVAVTTPGTTTFGEQPFTGPRIVLDDGKPVVAGITMIAGNFSGRQFTLARLLGPDDIFNDGFGQ